MYNGSYVNRVMEYSIITYNHVLNIERLAPKEYGYNLKFQIAIKRS